MYDPDKILHYAENIGVDYIDVRINRKIYENILLDNGVVREYSLNEVMGLGVRVLVDGYMGFAATNKPDSESYKEVVDNAVKAARALRASGRKTRLYPRRTSRDRVVSRYVKDPLDVDSESKIGLLREIYGSTRSVEGIVSSTVRYGFELDERLFVSSWGDRVETTTRLIGIGVLEVGKSGNVMERIWDSESRVAGWEFIEGMDWNNFAKEVAQLAVEASKAPVVKPGKYTAILDNEIVGLLLHEAFGHATEGDEVESGTSILKDRIGEKVASEHVTIVDDGSIEGGFYLAYDDEGTRKVRVATVEKGVLKTYLHSLSTAVELGGKPTGNARAENFAKPILVRQTNTYMEPDDWSVEELFNDTGSGIYIRGRGAMGGQVDPSVGTFTFTAGPSYIIENGEPVRLVRGVMMSGMILETLKNVDAVAKDLVVKTSVFGGCGKGGQLARVGDGGPHIRVRGLTVGGGR